ncbi:MAG: TolC family outer membrane protein [Alphaproteobacteria bacterium]
MTARVWFAVFLCCAPWAVAAETLPVTLEEACSLAYQTHPQLKAARLQVEALDEEYNKALSGFRPTIKVYGDKGYVDETVDKRFGDNDKGDQVDARDPYTVGVMHEQPLYRGGKTMAEMDLAVAQIAVGRETLRHQTQQVLLDTLKAYVGVVTAQEILTFHRAYQQILEDNVIITEARFQAGDVTMTDVSLSKSRVARARTDVNHAQRTLAAKRADFMAMVGVLPGSLRDMPKSPKTPETLAAATDRALAKNPLLQAAYRTIEAKDADVDRISSGYRPELSVESKIYRQEDPSFDDQRREGAETKVVLKIPLYDGGMVSAWTRQAKKERQRASHQKDSVYRDVVRDVTLAWRDLETATLDLDSTQAEVTSALKASDGMKEELDMGFRSTLDFLDAEQDLLGAQRRFSTTKGQKLVAEYTLLAAMGELDIRKLSKKTKPYNPKDHFEKIKGLSYGWWQE